MFPEVAKSLQFTILRGQTTIGQGKLILFLIREDYEVGPAKIEIHVFGKPTRIWKGLGP